MTGGDIVGTLLRDFEPLLEIVPAEQIKLGMLPANVPLPALLVRTISLIDRQPLKRRGWCRSTARVAVMVRAANYRDQNSVIGLVRSCCAGFIGDSDDAKRVSILTAGLGPDLIGAGNVFEQTQDFRVSFDAPV